MDNRTALGKKLWSHARMSPGDGCWDWVGPNGGGSHGYALLVFAKQRFAVHRLAWELTFGPIQEGMMICHRCDNPRCVRPEHLFLGSQHDNMLDKAVKGRAPRSRLTAAQVSQIRASYPGRTQRQLATTYGISHTAVGYILRGEHWKHLAGPTPKPRARHHHAKLTEDEVRLIRALCAAGQLSKRAIGERFGVSDGAVKGIVLGKTWKHVT